MTMIQGVVFSRDRAMQLDATLKSFLRCCRDYEDVQLSILYLATNEEQAQQYAQLRRDYAGHRYIAFLPEQDFRRDLLYVLTPYNSRTPQFHWQMLSNRLAGHLHRLPMPWLRFASLPYVLFLVDDNVFVREFSLCRVAEALQHQSRAIGFSLRLGENITHSYVADRPETMPDCSRLDHDVCAFDWTSTSGSFGYPLELSSSVYRIRELLPLINRLQFQNPNTLESQLASNAGRFRRSHPQLLCYRQSVTFCNPVNKVQTIYANRAGNRPEYSAGQLAQLFDNGYRIDVAAMADFVPSACHQEVEFRFHQPEVLQYES